MMSKEEHEAKASAWLERFRESQVANESLAQYARRNGLSLSEAYRWLAILRRAGQLPGSDLSGSDQSASAPKKSKPRFVGVRIAPPVATAALRLDLQLANGRRAQLVLSDERQLPRVLMLLEQSA